MNVSCYRDLHCVIMEFAWKPECHQRGVSEAGTWVGDGKGDLDTSKFPQQLCHACYVKVQRCQDT